MVKVLLVDDDEDLLEMVTLMLTANNFQVESLPRGDLLFDAIEAQTPDILLMDVFLGDSDGRQLCRQLKSSHTYAGFPIFLYSAADISNASFKESNADFFLRKPFNMTELVNNIYERVKK